MSGVKIIDVAREAGVSLGTVSNALNHPDKVRPETRVRIEAAIDMLGYTPNQSARLLAGGTNAAIGLVLPRLSEGLSIEIAGGARAECHARGYSLLIADVGGDERLERRYLSSFMGAQVAAVLIQPVGRDSWSAPSSPSSIPNVFLDVKTDAAGCFVVADSQAQGRIIAEHARARQAKHVAVIGRSDSCKLELRLSGIREALTSHGEINLEIIDAGDGDVSGDGYSLGLELARRARRNRPDFIIGLTDVLAAGALAACLRTGLAVPEDVMVAGCDGNPLAWNGMLELTTCAPVGYEMGRRAVRASIEAIGARQLDRIGTRGAGAAAARGERASAHREEIIRPFLLARASTLGSRAREGDGCSSATSHVPELNLGVYL
ncbi:transcriptional regulator, LacI family [Coriobacterium glomerans PW2]|uniref:Transcriptional regulator, LacI family n=1 Tax=Coriobacterium glomerans (strain ATCC 49209 / DSM 20642 / JCM 10262 / PW2) TaxID=700015 RepID=F2N9V3_CORGP|nr:LacI family DNA-binding transcriptional regulator [Coriobacterium glomerans]AEB06208.1 transcriptional regulator, LacI family [Coriobacterium glomerans PW2]